MNNTLISGEDHEIFHRLKRLDAYRGLYDPSIAVRHHVPARRLTRRYFRRWFYWHGKTLARMPKEISTTSISHRCPLSLASRAFSTASSSARSGNSRAVVGSRDALSVLIEELRTVQHLGYFAQCWEWSIRRNRDATPMPESGSFLDGQLAADEPNPRKPPERTPRPEPFVGSLAGGDRRRTRA